MKCLTYEGLQHLWSQIIARLNTKVDKNTEVDGTLSDTSTNPIQNKAITIALNNKAPMYDYGTTDLAAGTSPLATGQLYFVYE